MTITILSNTYINNYIYAKKSFHSVQENVKDSFFTRGLELDIYDWVVAGTEVKV